MCRGFNTYISPNIFLFDSFSSGLLNCKITIDSLNLTESSKETEVTLTKMIALHSMVYF